jgi:hypothetical protein
LQINKTEKNKMVCEVSKEDLQARDNKIIALEEEAKLTR